MDLDAALNQFDRAEITLERLSAVNAELQSLVPEGINFAGTSPDGLQYRELCRQFSDFAEALPAIDGFRIDAVPLGLDEIAQARLDASEVGESEMTVHVENQIVEPTTQINEYRHRFARARRSLVRERLRESIREVDQLLAPLEPAPDPDGLAHDVWTETLSEWAQGFDWNPLAARIAEIRRLLSEGSFNDARWGDLARHLSFAEPVDLRDILVFDWPSVREDIERQLYTEREPVPIEAEDLAELAASNPEGSVTTALDWGKLDDESFERLIFNIINNTEGYENAQWLTRTRAPDRGRDLSVERVTGDSLIGTRRTRVMIQCRHRPTQSVSVTDASDAVAKAELWRDPPFDVVVIATTGRFTTDAIDWVETRNLESRLQVEMWPESHLEMLLAARPALIEEFQLRL